MQKLGNWQTLTLAIIVILLAAVPGLWRLEVESIWHDEAWSIRAIQSPTGTPDDNTPYLYYLTLHALQRSGAGETPFALRYGSVLIHLVMVALGFRIAARWYGGLAGFTAGILLGLSPLLWEYAQEVRAYVAVPLFALAFLGGVEALLQPRDQIPLRVWAFLLISEIAGLYTHNLVVPLVAWLNLVVFGVWGWRWWRGHQQSLRKLIIWLVSQIGLFILYIPWLRTQSPSGTPLNTSPALNFDLLRDIGQAYFFPVQTDNLPDYLITWLLMLAAISLMIMLLVVVLRRSCRTWLILSQLIALPIFSTLLIIRASIDFHPRYYVAGVPALMLILASNIDTKPTLKLLINGLIIGVVGAVSFYSLETIAANREYQHDDFQAMADYYADLPSDSLILIPFDDEPALQVYFADQIEADFLNIPLHSSPAIAIQRINAALESGQYQRIELLTWFQLPADERGMYPCLLAASGQRGDRFITYGLQSETFYPEQPITMQGLALSAQFEAPLYLTGAAYLASAESICLQTDFRKTGDTASDEIKVAVDVLTPAGWTLTDADGSIRRDDQAQVGDWAIEDSGSAFLLLTLPEGTPADTYEWLMRLYTDQQPSGYDVISPDQRVLGKDLRLPALMLMGNPFESLPQQSAVLRDNSNNQVIYSGQEFKVELLNRSAADLLTLQGEDFILVTEITPEALAWGIFRLPSDAISGQADLLLDDQVIATYTIQATDFLFTEPALDISVDREFPSIGRFVGIRIPETEIEPGEALTVDLVWQAGDESPVTDYVVFVQLLSADGRVIMQSDAMPAGNQRPTRSWIADEYIIDSHNLHWNDLEYRGKARLIVGMYHPTTAERIILNDGADFVAIPTEIMIR